MPSLICPPKVPCASKFKNRYVGAKPDRTAVCLLALTPGTGWACACGCGVFDVGTGTMMPTDEGGTVWLEYDFANQSQNWHGNSSAPASHNGDKQLRTDFCSAGMQYMFNRSWGIEGDVPFTHRYFKKTTDFPNTGDTQVFNHAALATCG